MLEENEKRKRDEDEVPGAGVRAKKKPRGQCVGEVTHENSPRMVSWCIGAGN
jgi:hypothetical protein